MACQGCGHRGSPRAVLSNQGLPIDNGTRRLMERHFSHDFSGVRVHANGKAAASAKAFNARAYTYGQHIVFDAGEYDPGTGAGLRLLAHELAHTIQAGDRDPSDAVTAQISRPGRTHEQEADVAEERISAGKKAEVRRSHGNLIYRKERGTYISKHGGEDYLKAAKGFYKSWGYPNVKSVSDIKDVLDDLDKSKDKIDSFRIVSHGYWAGNDLGIGLMPEIYPEEFTTHSASLTGEEQFREILAEYRIIPDTAYDRLLKTILNYKETASILERIGVTKDDLPSRTSPMGILLRALIETWYVTNVKTKEGVSPKVPGFVTKFNKGRVDTYKKLILSSITDKDKKKDLEAAVGELMNKIADALNAEKKPLNAISQEEMNAMGADFNVDAGIFGKNKADAANKAILEGSGEGTFLKKLRSVREKITADTHIDVRGCNVGGTPALMDAIRSFFGRPDQLPSISAPDIYQFFMPLDDIKAYGTNAEEVDALKADWDDPGTGLKRGFDDMTRIKKGEIIKSVNDTKLEGLCKRYGLDLKRIMTLNPELDRDAAISAGTTIWLVARPPIKYGASKGLDDFCEKHLGSKYKWPTLWSANPEIKDPKKITPDQDIWLVPPELRDPVASADRTLDDFTKSIRDGNAFVATNPSGTPMGKQKAYMDYSSKAGSISSWLATQGYDYKGASPEKLKKLYGGNDKKFLKAMSGTFIELLSPTYPNIDDPIFPDDPRYSKHIIRRP